MGYHGKDGIYHDTKEIDLSPAAALTADAQSAAVEVGSKSRVNLTLDVTAVSASDTLDVTIEGSHDGTNNWYSLGTFTQATGVTTERKSFPTARFIRANYNVTGASISISCTLKGEAA